MHKRLVIIMLALLALVAGACAGGTDDAESSSGQNDVMTEGSAEPTADGDMADGELADGGSTDGDMNDDAMGDGAAGGDMGDEDMGDDASGAGNGTGSQAPLALAAEDAPTLQSLQTAASTTGNFEGVITTTDPENPSVELTIGLSGSYDTSIDASAVNIDLSQMADAAGEGEGGFAGLEMFFAEPLKMITIGDESWLSWSLITMFAGGDGNWMAMDDAGDLADAADASGLGLDSPTPTDVLASLEDLTADFTLVGTETLRGIETAHWTATVTVTLDEAVGVESATLDVWVDGNGVLHRYQLSVSESAEGAGMFRFDVFDHGSAVDIARPADDDIIAEEGFSLTG